MHRRTFAIAVAALPFGFARAEHGWEAYDLAVPLYLEGEVTHIIWGDPHPHLELLHRPAQQVPADLRLRQIPAQKQAVDARRLLAEARVAPRSTGRFWRVELPSLARLQAWDMRRPKVGQVLGVIGFAGPPVTGTPTLRAEILFIGDRAYPMRSDPA
ncbi:MAG: hypothetical protein ACO1PB_19760 [Ramlibacter sp.]